MGGSFSDLLTVSFQGIRVLEKPLGHMWHVTSHQSETSKKKIKIQQINPNRLQIVPKSTSNRPPNNPKSIQNCLRRPQARRRAAKDTPRPPQDRPRPPQDRPRPPLRPPKSAPRPPKSAPRPPKTALRPPQGRPRAPQDRPRSSQDGPRATQDHPKTAQDRSKTAFKRLFFKNRVCSEIIEKHKENQRF